MRQSHWMYQWPNIGSRMNREVHVRFWERAEVKFLRATRECTKPLSREGHSEGVALYDLGRSPVFWRCRISRVAPETGATL